MVGNINGGTKEEVETQLKARGKAASLARERAAEAVRLADQLDEEFGSSLRYAEEAAELAEH